MHVPVSIRNLLFFSIKESLSLLFLKVFWLSPIPEELEVVLHDTTIQPNTMNGMKNRLITFESFNYEN